MQLRRARADLGSQLGSYQLGEEDDEDTCGFRGEQIRIGV